MVTSVRSVAKTLGSNVYHVLDSLQGIVQAAQQIWWDSFLIQSCDEKKWEFNENNLHIWIAIAHISPAILERSNRSVNS